MRQTLFITPHVLGVFAVEELTNGALAPSLVGLEGLHHCLPFDVVKSPNTVNGEQRLPWIKLHQRPDHACDAILFLLEWKARTWNGMQTRSNATPRRKVSPVTIPLMPPAASQAGLLLGAIAASRS